MHKFLIVLRLNLKEKERGVEWYFKSSLVLLEDQMFFVIVLNAFVLSNWVVKEWASIGDEKWQPKHLILLILSMHLRKMCGVWIRPVMSIHSTILKKELSSEKTYSCTRCFFLWWNACFSLKSSKYCCSSPDFPVLNVGSWTTHLKFSGKVCPTFLNLVLQTMIAYIAALNMIRFLFPRTWSSLV